MSSPTATLALLLVIPLTLAVFFTNPRVKAAVLAMLGSTLLLPELTCFWVPLLPALDKATLPYLAILLALIIKAPGEILKPKTMIPFFMLFGFIVLLGVGTAQANPDAFVIGTWIPHFFPGMKLNDGLFLALTDFASMGMPFLLGAFLFRSTKDLGVLARLFVAATLLYSVLVLFETRMSPQLHRMVYGWMAIPEFGQARRFGGYRPNVFFSHGLALSMWVVVALTFVLATRASSPRLFRFKPKAWIWYLFFILLMCRSMGAYVFGVLVLALHFGVKTKMRMKITTMIALVAIFYPVLRSSGQFPVDTLLDLAGSVSEHRMASLQFRFFNEDALLEKALERPWFGWGSYGRNLLWDEVDGNTLSTVPDGYWIIRMSTQGYLSFLLGFGLLLGPVWVASRRLKYIETPEERDLVVGFALAVTCLTADLIPNGLFSNYPYFLAGALLGAVRAYSKKARRNAKRSQGRGPAVGHSLDPSRGAR